MLGWRSGNRPQVVVWFSCRRCLWMRLSLTTSRKATAIVGAGACRLVVKLSIACAVADLARDFEESPELITTAPPERRQPAVSCSRGLHPELFKTAPPERSVQRHHSLGASPTGLCAVTLPSTQETGGCCVVVKRRLAKVSSRMMASITCKLHTPRPSRDCGRAGRLANYSSPARHQETMQESKSQISSLEKYNAISRAAASAPSEACTRFI